MNDQQKEHWLVQDGLIRYDGKVRTLSTTKSFRDYRLRVDFLLPRQADSGVFVRGSKQLNIWTWQMGSGEMWEHQGAAKTNAEKAQYIPYNFLGVRLCVLGALAAHPVFIGSGRWTEFGTLVNGL